MYTSLVLYVQQNVNILLYCPALLSLIITDCMHFYASSILETCSYKQLDSLYDILINLNSVLQFG